MVLDWLFFQPSPGEVLVDAYDTLREDFNLTLSEHRQILPDGRPERVRCLGLSKDPGPCSLCNKITGNAHTLWQLKIKIDAMEIELKPQGFTAKNFDFRPKFSSPVPGEPLAY